VGDLLDEPSFVRRVGRGLILLEKLADNLMVLLNDLNGVRHIGLLPPAESRLQRVRSWRIVVEGLSGDATALQGSS
jgi:hypothetical protein